MEYFVLAGGMLGDLGGAVVDWLEPGSMVLAAIGLAVALAVVLKMLDWF
jgi:hypothetical protein